jgi:hypothetical protein
MMKRFQSLPSIPTSAATPGRSRCDCGGHDGPGQGLTLVHFSAHLKRFCVIVGILGVLSSLLGIVRGGVQGIEMA